jgi:hypothetical protein
MAVFAYWSFFRETHIEAIVIVLALSIQLFLVELGKIFHHSPRPFWVFDDVRGGTCYT